MRVLLILAAALLLSWGLFQHKTQLSRFTATTVVWGAVEEARISNETETSYDEYAHLPALQVETPFLINAGLGTTGTTTLYEAMCELGLPSVHWHRKCIRPVGVDPNDYEVDPLVEAGVRAHRALLGAFKRTKMCAKEARGAINVTLPCNYEKVVAEMFDLATQVVKSGLVFLADTPYPFLVEFLVEVAKKERRHSAIVLTERDPKTWAVRRSGVHGMDCDVMCMNVDHAFDLKTCLEVEEMNAKNMTRCHDEYKVGHRKWDTAYLSFLEEALNTRQHNIKNMDRVITINLWNENSTTVEAVAQLMKERMAHVLPSEALARFDNEGPLASRRGCVGEQ